MAVRGDAMPIALWLVTTFLIPGIGIALSLYTANMGWWLLCFAPVLWAIDWKRFH